MGKDLCSSLQLSLRFAPALDLALGRRLVGMDVFFRRSITVMRAGRNDVRWEKEQKGGTREVLALQRSPSKAAGFLALE